MEPIKKNREEANNKDPASVPFFIHEAEMTRMERVNKRLLLLAKVPKANNGGANQYRAKSTAVSILAMNNTKSHNLHRHP